ILVAPPAPAGKPAPGGAAFAVYKARTPKDDDGLAFVEIKKNERYAVRLVNEHDFDIAVSLTIHGLSMFAACDKESIDPGTDKKMPLRDKESGKPLFNHVIVPRGKALLIRGWFINLKESDEFKVTDYAKSLVAELKAPATPGVITAAYHAC